MELSDNLQFSQLGHRSILISFSDKIDRDLLNIILKIKYSLKKILSEQILYINHSYNSILITYKTTIENINSNFSEINEVLNTLPATEEIQFYEWKLPVCYDKKFGIDLEEISYKNNLSRNQIISTHSGVSYLIYFLGFLPGFLYLEGLDAKIHFPRKIEPRLKINRGDVGIGGSQTGIYPMDSPGGWNIIGNTPIKLFDSTKANPCFAKAGDQVKFYAISFEEHKHILEEVKNDKFQLQKSEII